MELLNYRWYPVTAGLMFVLRIPWLGDLFIPVADRVVHADLPASEMIKAPALYGLIYANLRKGNGSTARKLARKTLSINRQGARGWEARDRDILTLGVVRSVTDIYAGFDVPTPSIILDHLQTLAARYCSDSPKIPDGTAHEDVLKLVHTVKEEMVQDG